MTIRLTLPPPISANRYWRTYRNRVTVSAEAKTYKTAVGWIARAAIDEPLTGDVAVTLRVYRKAKRGDLDNYNKVLLDSLSGIAYTDDSQVTELHTYRYDDKHNPRVEVEITPL
jgi:crossover junction endodeoxyribonuclease RusA